MKIVSNPRRICTTIKRENIEHKYKVVPDLDHDYPINFEELLKEAIEYIGNENNK